MDPELIAEQMIARFGVDGARSQLAGSSHPEDMAILAALSRHSTGRRESGGGGRFGVVGQIGAGLGEVLPTFMRGALNLGGAAIPGEDPLQRAGNALGGLLEQRREESAPQGGLQTAARIAGRIGGEIGLGVATAGASRAVGAGRLGMLAADAAAGGTIAAAGPEDSALSLVSDDLAQSPVARFLGDTALVGAGDLIGRGIKALRGSGAVDEIIQDASKRTHLRMAADEIESQIPQAKGGAKRILEEGLEQAREELSTALPEVTIADELVDEAGNLVRGAKVYYGDKMVGNIGRIVGARANNPELFDEAVDTVRRIVAQHGDEILETPKDWDASAELAKQFLIDGQYDEALKKLPGDMTVVETMAVSMMAKNNLKMSQKLSRQLYDTTLSPEVRNQVQEELLRVGREADEAFWKRFVQGSESARRLAVFRWESANLDDPLAIMTAAQRAFVRDRGFVPIPPELRQHLLDLAEKAAGGDKGARKLLNIRIAQIDKSTDWEKFETLWKAGLLTSFTTPMANLTGNVTLAALERTKAAPAAFIDRLVSGAFGTDRTRSFAIRNVDEATDFAKRFADEIQGIGQKLEFRKKTVFQNLPSEYGGAETVFDKLKVNAIMDLYTSTIFASLEQGDRIFLQRAIARSATDYARTLVANSTDLKGNDAVRRVIKMIESPSDELVLHGISEAQLKAAQAGVREDALLATLRNTGKAAKIGAAGKSFADALTLGKGGEFLVPFSRTPANIAGRIIESSPIGLIAGVGELSWRGLKKLVRQDPGMTPEVQRAIVDRIGRGITGSSVIAFGAVLAHKGLMTGALPEEQGKRDMFFQAGLQPNSIKIGDTWVGLERLSPLGNLLVLGASMYNQFTGGENWSAAATGSLASVGSTLTEQPFLTGVRRTLESISEPDRAGGQLETFAGSFVPNIVRGIARGVDPTIREQTGVGDALRAAVPGMSSDLPARIQPLGDEARRDKGVLGQLFIPAQLSQDERRDRIIGTLDSLGVSITRRSFERSAQDGESREMFERRARQEGQELRSRIEQMVSRPSFQRKDREEQRDAIESLVQSLRTKQTKRAQR